MHLFSSSSLRKLESGVSGRICALSEQFCHPARNLLHFTQGMRSRPILLPVAYDLLSTSNLTTELVAIPHSWCLLRIDSHRNSSYPPRFAVVGALRQQKPD